MQRLTRAIMGAVAALSGFASRRELLVELGTAGFSGRRKSYVGLHTPDSDAIHTRA